MHNSQSEVPDIGFLPLDLDIDDAEVEMVEVPLEEAALAVVGVDAVRPATAPAAERPEPPPPEEAGSGETGTTRVRLKTRYFAGVQLPVGETIRRARSIFAYWRQPFLIAAVLATVPDFLEGVGLIPGEESLARFALLAMGREFFAALFLGVSAYAVMRVMLEKPASLNTVMNRGLRQFPDVLMTVLFVAAIMAGLIGVALLAVQAGLIPLWSLLFLVFPFIYLQAMFILAFPVCVVERRGPLGSLRRSAVLTAHFRLSIFLIFFVWNFIVGWIAFLVNMVVVIFCGWVLRGSLHSSLYGIATTAGSLVVTVWAMAIKNVLVSLIYYRLRLIKDEVTVETLSRSFR
ncbi:MAG: hypothetical protein LIP77_10280 [Planctomycetes bacterium]|nr:hypothetical protein [Planctomycetota bacterium]